MSRVFEGQLAAGDLRFAIIVSRFNSFITERLLDGAMDALTRTGANLDLVDVIKVPGSWEVPLVAAEVARQNRYDRRLPFPGRPRSGCVRRTTCDPQP